MRSPLVVVAICAAVMIGGLLLVSVSSLAGAVIAIAGIAGMGVFLVYAEIRAARNSPGLIYTPGKARREWKAEQEAARRAEQRKAGRGQ